MGGAVYLGALNLRQSIRNSVAHLFGGTLRYDMSVGFARPYSADRIEAAIAGIDGVSRVESWSGSRAAIARAEGMLGNAFSIAALPAASPMVAFAVDSGRWLVAGDSSGLVVNRSSIRVPHQTIR